MEKITTSIAETVILANGKKERKEVGTIPFLVPTLAELAEAISKAEEVRDAKTEILSYKDSTAQFVYDAVCAAARGILVSRLMPKSVSFKAGYAPWTDFQGLITSTGVRGEALAVYREFVAAFSSFVAKLGKSEKWSAAMIGFASNRKSLQTTTSSNKAVFAGKLYDFSLDLSAEDAGKYENILVELGRICSQDEVDLDDEA